MSPKNMSTEYPKKQASSATNKIPSKEKGQAHPAASLAQNTKKTFEQKTPFSHLTKPFDTDKPLGPPYPTSLNLPCSPSPLNRGKEAFVPHNQAGYQAIKRPWPPSKTSMSLTGLQARAVEEPYHAIAGVKKPGSKHNDSPRSM